MVLFPKFNQSQDYTKESILWQKNECENHFRLLILFYILVFNFVFVIFSLSSAKEKNSPTCIKFLMTYIGTLILIETNKLIAALKLAERIWPTFRSQQTATNMIRVHPLSKRFVPNNMMHVKRKLRVILYYYPTRHHYY